MLLDKWIKYFEGDMDAVNAVYYLQKVKSYTDEETIEAIGKIEKNAGHCGLTRMDIIKTIFINETAEFK